MKSIFKLRDNKDVEKGAEDRYEGDDPNILYIQSRPVLRTILWASQKYPLELSFTERE